MRPRVRQAVGTQRDAGRLYASVRVEGAAVITVSHAVCVLPRTVSCLNSFDCVDTTPMSKTFRPLRMLGVWGDEHYLD